MPPTMASVKISDEALDEFINLYKHEFNEDISRTQGNEMAFRLMTLYGLLSQKLPEKEITPPDPQRHSIGFRL